MSSTETPSQRHERRLRRQRETAKAGLTYPHTTPPSAGETIEVAEGIHWLQLPMPLALDHINAYLLDDGDSWTIVDSGLQTAAAQEVWQAVLRHRITPAKPLARVVITHHHPDHIGLAGWLIANYGGILVAPRMAWLGCHFLLNNNFAPLPAPLHDYFGRAGMPAHLREHVFAKGFAGGFDFCATPPIINSALHEGSTIAAAARQWRVVLGQGHAPDHVCLWCERHNILLAGDQILPQITPVVGAWPLERADDPIAHWIDSCHRLAALIDDETLILPGHNEPFYGGKIRLQQLSTHHADALRRLEQLAAQPICIADTFPILFKREVVASTATFAVMEARAHVNHLVGKGRLRLLTPPGSDKNTDWYAQPDYAA